MAWSRVLFELNRLRLALPLLAAVLSGCVNQAVVVSIHDRGATRGETADTKLVPTMSEHLPPSPPLAGEIAAEPPTSRGEELIQEASAAAVEPAPEAAVVPVGAVVYFDFDRFAVSKEARAILRKESKRVRAEIKGDKNRKIVVEGHCDERGTRDYNLLLGEQRAKAVKRALEDLGFPTQRISITSYGKERPFCPDHSETCWRQNRRVHLTIQ
jgi:peptidoglycan-associated lipoprotein